MITAEPQIVLRDPRPGQVGWASSDLELWFKQELILYGDGRIVLDGDVTVAPMSHSLKNVKVTSEDGKEIVEHAKPRNKGKCKGCGSKASISHVVRWFGFRWYGIPMPVRYMRRWFTKDAPTMDSYDGCGCIIKLKEAWYVLRGFGRLTVIGSKRVWAA